MNRRSFNRPQRGPTQRQLRVGEELRHALARILARGGMRDPTVAEWAARLTVTEVRVSPDLKNATVFVVPLGGTGIDAAVAVLNHAAGFFRARLAQEIALRSVPRITFAPDLSFDQADRVHDILNRPRVRRDLDGTAAPAPEEETNGR